MANSLPPEKDPGHVCHSSVTSPLSQSLPEMDFERGIWSAALSGNAVKLAGHLDKGTSPNQRDPTGYTALHYSCRQGHLEACRLLVERGASVNAQTSGGSTPLHRAAYAGHVEVVQLLLGNKGDPRVTDIDGKTALHKAFEGKQPKVISLLLSKDNELRNIPDNKGRTPMLT